MLEEEIGELDEQEMVEARANPKAYGLDEDGWPDADEFNAAITESVDAELQRSQSAKHQGKEFKVVRRIAFRILFRSS